MQSIARLPGEMSVRGLRNQGRCKEAKLSSYSVLFRTVGLEHILRDEKRDPISIEGRFQRYVISTVMAVVRVFS